MEISSLYTSISPMYDCVTLSFMITVSTFLPPLLNCKYLSESWTPAGLDNRLPITDIEHNSKRFQCFYRIVLTPISDKCVACVLFWNNKKNVVWHPISDSTIYYYSTFIFHTAAIDSTALFWFFHMFLYGLMFWFCFLMYSPLMIPMPAFALFAYLPLARFPLSHPVSTIWPKD